MIERFLQHVDRPRLIAVTVLALAAAGILALLAAAGQPALLLASGLLIALAAGAFSLLARVEARSLVEQARSLIQVGQFQRAMPTLNHAIELSPRLVQAYLARSAAYAGLGQLDLAVEDTERAVKLAPRLPDARLARARIAIHRGLFEDAIHDLRAGIREQPDWEVGYLELAQLHVRLEDYDSSLATLRDLSVHGPSDPVRYDALILSGWVYEEKLEDLDKAIATYSQAIPILPDRKIGYLRRAQTYRRRGDLYQAAEDLLRAAQRVATPEDDGQYHWLRAACYWGRYTITSDSRDLLAWVDALNHSVEEDAPEFREQSRQWLVMFRDKHLKPDAADEGMHMPPPPRFFPN